MVALGVSAEQIHRIDGSSAAIVRSGKMKDYPKTPSLGFAS